MFRKIVALILVLALLVPMGSALAVTYYRVNTTWLKAHEKPQYDAKVVDSYRRDFAVTIERKGTDGWARVRFRPGGAQVYVQTKYLTACSSYTVYVSKDSTVAGTDSPITEAHSQDSEPSLIPTISKSNFQYDASTKARLFTVNGKLLRESMGAPVSTHGLNRGIYLLQIENGSIRKQQLIQVR